MPRTATAVKRAAVAGYGGRIVLCEPTLAAREATLADVVAATGATVVHPYNDARVIAGQGTAALELLDEVPGLDVVMAPVGGGGLLSGTAIAVTGALAGHPGRRRRAGRGRRRLPLAPGGPHPARGGSPQTIADGLLTSLGTLTFAIIRERVAEIVTVSEDAIVAAMRHIWERMKIVIEPSSAVPLGALLEGKLPAAGRRIGVIVSGGNVDLADLPWSRE